MTLEMNYLEHFTAAVEAGSIGKAARSLNISQPGLTRSIRLLEQQLEVTLLERSAKGVKPTDYGTNFYTRAKSILLEAERAQIEIREMRGETERIISIGTLPSQASFILPEATLKFLASNQNVKVKVIQKPRSEILDSLSKGEFDFIFSILEEELLGRENSTAPNSDKDFISRLLFYDRPAIIVRTNHPALKAGEKIAEELLKYPWIMPRPESDQRIHINNLYNKTGLPLPKRAVECQTAPYLKTLVTESDFVGILPTNFISLEEQAGFIQSIKMPGLKNIIPIGIKYRADRPISGLAQNMFLEIENVCRELKASMSDRLEIVV